MEESIMPHPHGLPLSDDSSSDDNEHYQGESLYHRTNDGLVTHTLKGERKIVEAFITPPPFLLYIWACFPLLLLSTVTLKAFVIAIIATTINFIIIHRDTLLSVRYIIIGMITLSAIFLYGEGII